MVEDEGQLNALASSTGLDDLDRTVATLGFPGFKIIAKVGSGGMARVYKAQQLSVRRYVAIKVLNPDMMSAVRIDIDAARRRENGASLARGHVAVVTIGVAIVAMG
jgi:serine/threonine protein kinase